MSAPCCRAQQKVSMSRTIGKLISPSVSASSLTGPTLIIWCTAGVSGMCAPAILASFGLHTPQAMTTVSASMSPPVVRTRLMAPSSTSRPVTSTVGTTVSAPVSRARSRMIVPARSESTTPTDGVQKAPTIWDGSRNGTFSATCAGVTSSDSMPQIRAEVIRRRSSSIRASVRATSNPPDSVKTPISLYWRMLSSVRSVISREWSTGKMKFEACPVEPPGLGSAPLSIWTMSRQPSRARWWTRLLPTMPAPITTTRAVGGTEAMEASLREAGDVASYATLCAMRDNPQHAAPPPHLSTGPDGVAHLAAWPTREDGRRASAQPGLHLVRVGVDPLLRRLVRVHLLLRDVGRDQVLVLVGDLEALDELDRRGAGVGELLGDQLVELVRRVVAGHLRRVRVTARGVGRKVHLDQLHLREEPLGLVEVGQQRLVVLLRAAEALDQRGLAAADDHLVVEVQVLHQRLVVGDVGRVAIEELSLAARLRGLEHRGVLVEVLPVRDVGVLLGHPRRDVPADDPVAAGQPGVLDALLVLDVLLHQVGVAPVLHDRVDGAVGHPLPADLLLHVLVADVAAELGLRHLADEVRVDDVPRPGVDRDVQVAAVLAPRRRRVGVLDVAAAATGQHQRGGGRDGGQPEPTGSYAKCLQCASLLLPGPPRAGTSCQSAAAEAGSGVAHEPLDHDPERGDRDAGGESLAEQLGLREAGHHDVAEAAGPDQSADDDHRQHIEQTLVGSQHERLARHRDLHLGDHLPGRDAGGLGRLHGGR